MARSIRALLLLSIFLWQATATFGSTLPGSIEIEHLLTHAQNIDHHHHVDGAPHLEDSDGDGVVRHMHVDASNAHTALLVDVVTAFLNFRPAPPLVLLQTNWSSPALEGPLRSPKTTA